jgi:branched-chain amino acid transport system substrate-binding protein
LTGAGAAALAEGYESATNKQWTQPLGYVHALFEVAVDTLKRASNVLDRKSIRDALAATRLETMVGPVSWSDSPIKNVAKTPLVGGQWVKGQKRMFDLVIVDNRTAPAIPAAAMLKLLA